MKIYRVSQEQQMIDQEAIAEVSQAINYINQSVANINQSLEIIENSGVSEMFRRDTLINAIQSGDFTGIDQNNVNDALNAMQMISQSVPVINNALRIIQDNPNIAKMLNADISSMQTTIVNSLQSGDYSGFSSMMADFQSDVGGLSGTSSL